MMIRALLAPSAIAGSIRQRRNRLLLDSTLAVLAVALISFLIGLYPEVHTLSLGYVLVIQVFAGIRGLYAGVIAALCAVVFFDLFVASPRYSLIAYNEGWLSLSFLLPGLNGFIRGRWGRLLFDSMLAVLATALVTFLIVVSGLYPQVHTLSLGYVLVIMILASIRGVYVGVLASLLAVIFFGFFVVLPDTPIVVFDEDWISLSILLLATIVTSQLAAHLRGRSVRAIEREQELRIRQAQEMAVMQERQHLSRELHDSVSQALYGISLGAHTTKDALESEPEQARDSVDYIIDLAEVALAEMRALIFELRSESLATDGLVEALKRQIAVLRTRHRLHVETEFNAEPDLPIEHKEALYRVAQEAFHNIIKHAHAMTVLLKLKAQNGSYLLEIRDDGKGFDQTASFPGHFGLSTMQERMAKIGGTLSIESAVGKGTSVCAQIRSR